MTHCDGLFRKVFLHERQCGRSTRSRMTHMTHHDAFPYRASNSFSTLYWKVRHGASLRHRAFGFRLPGCGYTPLRSRPSTRIVQEATPWSFERPDTARIRASDTR